VKRLGPRIAHLGAEEGLAEVQYGYFKVADYETDGVSHGGEIMLETIWNARALLKPGNVEVTFR
jgi:hypothetical protein